MGSMGVTALCAVYHCSELASSVLDLQNHAECTVAIYRHAGHQLADKGGHIHTSTGGPLTGSARKFVSGKAQAPWGGGVRYTACLITYAVEASGCARLLYHSSCTAVVMR